MEKRKNLVEIHKNIGDKKYNELFGKEISYIRVSQSIYNEVSYYNTSKVAMKFSEAILLICNSFQALIKQPDISIVFMDKIEAPFDSTNLASSTVFVISDTHKSFYEMILNYQFYYHEFENINEKLIDIIVSKSLFIEVFIYTGIVFDILFSALIGTLMFLYTLSFESILIKIINYLNMTMNVKNDNFNFSETYLKKN